MDINLISNSKLFMGCSPEETENILKNLNVHTKKFYKESFVFHEGENVSSIGLVLSGSVQIERIDILGDKSILGIAQKGDIFAEAYACIPNQPLLVDVVAREDSEILFIELNGIFNCKLKGGCEMKFLSNLMRVTARKNLGLSMRIIHSSPKKIRDKLYSYFSEQVSIQKSMQISIPLNRQQLADYLGVERTALSKELGKMKSEGLIDYRKNIFTIKKGD